MIAGHSSGAAYANLVAKGTTKKGKPLKITNPGRVTLLDLDGFAPIGVPKTIQRICWNANGGAGKKPIPSRNFGAMTVGNNCGQVKTHQNQTCKDSWCLHFTLVNKNAKASLASDWPTKGYDGCSESALAWYP